METHPSDQFTLQKSIFRNDSSQNLVKSLYQIFLVKWKAYIRFFWSFLDLLNCFTFSKYFVQDLALVILSLYLDLLYDEIRFDNLSIS